MANETITDDYVRDHFRDDALFTSIKYERQNSNIRRVNELLKGHSKKGNGGDGKPDFIISFPSNCNYIIVGECKPSPTKHRSPEGNKPVEFAVDGVLHYAKYLKSDYNVLAIAVSGQTDSEMLVSHFYWKKGNSSYTEMSDNTLLSIGDYLQVFNDQFFINDFYTRDIAIKARYLNTEFNAYTIPEYKRCTLISAMLLALIDEDFKIKFAEAKTTQDLGKLLLSSIVAVFESEESIVRSKTLIIKEFEKILTEPIFTEEKIKHKKKKEKESCLEVLKYFILYLKQNISPIVEHANIGYDILGRFYTEFIRYAASEQKSGLVLTPSHITELFCDLAELRATDIVYDPCCGTGGFLVAAMQRLYSMAGNNLRKRRHIREKQLCGVEYRPDIFTYACSSMKFRGDGKSNIYNGDCFNHDTIIKTTHKPTVAFLNPPYDVGNARQMEFVEHALNVLDPNAHGRVVAVVQFSCAIKDEQYLIAVKKRLLQKHHLKAVISLPDDLFYPVGVVTCIMVFEANIPNAGRKTWFGFFKDDGFEKKKHLGRIDANNRYTELKNKLLSAYKNNDVILGFSVKQQVTENDEWCAEAYMETDYSNLTRELFLNKLRAYSSCLISQCDPNAKLTFTTEPLLSAELNLDIEHWEWFRYDQIFDIGKGFYNKKPDTHRGNEIPFVGAVDNNNGITEWYSIDDIDFASKTGDDNNAPLSDKIFEPNCITVSNNGSVGYAFYQNRRFTCTHDVNPLRLNQAWNKLLNPYIALFLCTVIEIDRFRWTYGRKWRPKRMPDSLIKLPVSAPQTPDWEFMERYIKSLPFSSFLSNLSSQQ